MSEGAGRNSQGAAGAPVIVVADDESRWRRANGQVLRAAGYEVIEVTDGQEAVQRVIQGGVDAVVLDIVMRQMDGIEACRLIKARTSRAYLPVLLLSSQSGADTKAQALRAGADDYLVKSADSGQLVSRVRALVNLRLRWRDIAGDRVRDQTGRAAASGEETLTMLQLAEFEDAFRIASSSKQPVACTAISVESAQNIESLTDRLMVSVRELVRPVDLLAVNQRQIVWLMPSLHIGQSLSVLSDLFGRLPEDILQSKALTAGTCAFPGVDVSTAIDLVRLAIDACRKAPAGQARLVHRRGMVYTLDILSLSYR